MLPKNKSILDNVCIKEEGFPLSLPNTPAKTMTPMQIVGHCPQCGKPIYGYVRLAVGEEPNVKSSCDCTSDLPFEDTVKTK